MIHSAVLLRSVLVPFLLGGGLLLGALLGLLLLQRGTRQLRWMRRQRLVERYRPLIDAVTEDRSAQTAVEALRAATGVDEFEESALTLEEAYSALVSREEAP